MESLAAMKSTGRIGDEVYVSAVALRATKGPAQLIMSSAYSLNFWDLQHFMVLVKPYSSHPQILVFDFQPEDPENIFVGLAALSGGSIKGSVFRRSLRRLPNRKCWFVGHSNVDDIMSSTTEDVINNFNQNWETELKIGHHDCRHYTNELVKCLTGEENVLDRIRRTDLPLHHDS